MCPSYDSYPDFNLPNLKVFLSRKQEEVLDLLCTVIRLRTSVTVPQFVSGESTFYPFKNFLSVKKSFDGNNVHENLLLVELKGTQRILLK